MQITEQKNLTEVRSRSSSSASISFRGQRLVLVSLGQDFPHYRCWYFLFGRREAENYEKERAKKGQMGKGRFWLKVASASFRTQLFAVVSLLLVFYPAGGVGNFFGRKMSDRKY